MVLVSDLRIQITVVLKRELLMKQYKQVLISANEFRNIIGELIGTATNPVPKHCKGKWFKIKIGQKIFRMHESEFQFYKEKEVI